MIDESFAFARVKSLAACFDQRPMWSVFSVLWSHLKRLTLVNLLILGLFVFVGICSAVHQAAAGDQQRQRHSQQRSFFGAIRRQRQVRRLLLLEAAYPSSSFASASGSVAF